MNTTRYFLVVSFRDETGEEYELGGLHAMTPFMPIHIGEKFDLAAWQEPGAGDIDEVVLTYGRIFPVIDVLHFIDPTADPMDSEDYITEHRVEVFLGVPEGWTPPAKH